jgi:hypothetical protein
MIVAINWVAPSYLPMQVGSKSSRFGGAVKADARN